MSPEGAGPAPVLLTGLTFDGHQLLVIPRMTALAELRTLSVLLNAATFEQARQDADAAELVDDWVPMYVEALRGAGQVDEDMDEDSVVVEHTWSGAPFDAEDFFGEGPFWRPDPRLSTVGWLATDEADLLRLCAVPDPQSGFDWWPATWLPARARQPLERLLSRLGYQVQRFPGLCAAYDDPDAFPVPGEQPASAEPGAVILTAISVDGLQVLAVPRDTALGELRTAALLAKVTTIGELRQDANAAVVVEQHLQQHRDELLDSPEVADLDDEAVEAKLNELTSDAAPYDADSVFGADDQLKWQGYADARVSTADWLGRDLPFVLETYGHYDEGEGPTYLKATWIAAEDRDDLELDLRALGYDVQHVEGLHELYIDPPLNIDELLPGEAPA